MMSNPMLPGRLDAKNSVRPSRLKLGARSSAVLFTASIPHGLAERLVDTAPGGHPEDRTRPDWADDSTKTTRPVHPPTT